MYRGWHGAAKPGHEPPQLLCAPCPSHTAADEPAQQPVPTQPLIWCELSAELTHLWSLEDLGLMGKEE